MPKVKIYNQEAKAVGEHDLADKIFAVKINEALVHQSVVTQLANERQVIANTKDRSEVRGGGKKPWKQKGTGRARAGSSRSPIWIGGGVTFGPLKERNFTKKINKKMKQQAMFMALSDKVNNDSLVVLENIELPEFKTKVLNNVIKTIEENIIKGDSKKRSILLVLGKQDEKVFISGRNLPGLEVINLGNINIVDLLKYKNLVLTVESVKKLEEKYK